MKMGFIVCKALMSAVINARNDDLRSEDTQHIALHTGDTDRGITAGSKI